MRSTLILLALVACDDSQLPAPDGPSGVIELGAPDDGAVVSVAISPLVMSPTFTTTTTDYYLRCALGSNPVSVTIAYASGDSETVNLDLIENEEISVVGQYFIRCVPPDFPNIDVTTHSEGAPTPGYYILQSDGYAVVLNTQGTPVWYAAGIGVINADAQQPNTISFMFNAVLGAIQTNPNAVFELRNIQTGSSTPIQTVGTPTDEHEFQITPDGHYLMQSFVMEQGVDLTGLESFGSSETIADCEIQEVDQSGNLVWSWLASDHIDPVQESLEPAVSTVNGETVEDVFHCNSLAVDTNGNLLYSLRHNNALYYIDRTSGTVLWKLGGTPYNKDGAQHIAVVNDPEGTFSMQHDARFLPNGDITIFDDHGAPSATGTARCVEYTLDFDANTAKVAWQYLGPLQSKYEGSCRRQADGHTIIGWGGMSPDPRSMTEVDANGNDVLDIALSIGGSVSYRAIKVPPSQLDITMLRASVRM